ncbi:MAG: ParB/RepB/Spo0J family partition protein [Myxococcota bacterium]
MNDRTLIPLERLRPNPDQVRRVFHRIPELAESICRDGLFQNLVVMKADDEGYHEIVAGERRYRAMLMLSEQGRLASHDIPCFIKGAEAALANVVENVMREDVPLWDLGRSYLNLSESGLTQAEIAGRIGKTQGHVSTAIQLARGLAPAVVGRLSTLPPGTFPAQRLLRLAALSDEHGEPDEAHQMRLFRKMLDAPDRKGKAAKRTRTEKETVWDRYQRLKQGKLDRRIDPVYRPFLDAVLKYLSGANAGLAP